MDFAEDFMRKRMLKRNPEVDSGSYGMNEEMTMDQKVAHCINDLMLSATSFQRLHLKVKNDGAYAAHMALGELYEALPGIADTIAEAYQGVTEMCLDWSKEAESYPKVLNSVEDAVSYIRELYERINMMQSYMPYSEITNELDNLKMLLNATKYKLLFLK
jgi:DNA-binding ferritin-like protein